MAKTYLLQRATSTVSTIDTVTNLISPVGSPLSGVSTGIPLGTINNTITFLGDTYALVTTAAGAIEIRKYDAIGNVWSTSSPTLNPSVVTLSVTSVVGAFSVSDAVNAGSATGTILAISGSNYTITVLSGVFPTSGVLHDSTSGATATISLTTLGNQVGTCLQVINNVLIAIWNESLGSYSKMSAVTTIDGVTWTTRENTSVNAALNGSFGGASAVWLETVFFATTLGIGNYQPGSGFGVIDTALSNTLTDLLTVQGGMAFWNGILYFVKPQTSGSPAKFYSLNSTWTFGASVPQWTSFNVTGIKSVGFTNISQDIGNYCLFVNKNDELSLFYSGSNNTKLATSSTSAFPQFIDVTNNLLPTEIANSPDLGINLYVDTKRRLNEQQFFIIRSVGLSNTFTTLANWDGANSVKIQASFPTADYIATSDRVGNYRTFTDLQPATYVADFFTSQTTQKRTYVKGSSFSGTFSVGDSFTVMSVVTLVISGLTGVISVSDSVTRGGATGTVASVNGLTLVVNVTSGVFTTGGLTDITSAATATVTSAVPSTSGTIAVVSGPILGLNVTSGAVLSGVTITDVTSSHTCTVSGNPIEVTAFPGRGILIYLLRDTYNRNMDIIGEYSTVGDVWLPMTQGGGDSGSSSLSSSNSGELHSFYWDSFADLEGNFKNMFLRLIGRISVSALEAPSNRFVAVVQEGYLNPPVTRSQSQQSLTLVAAFGSDFTAGETVTGATSGTTGFVQYADHTHLTLTAVVGSGFVPGAPGELLNGSIGGHSAHVGVVSSNIIATNTLPADETTDLEQLYDAVVTSSPIRAHTTYVFQGRLSSTQTRIRFLKLTLRGSNVGSYAQVRVYVSGQGSANQYLSGRPFSSFQSIPLADQEIVINDVDLSNQPSISGKRYSVVVEFDLATSSTAYVSNPYFRHE